MIADKTSSLYYAMFKERIFNRLLLLLFRYKNGYLARCRDNLRVLKENSCSIIQS